MASSKRNQWELLCLSFIALFLELAIIRWLAAEIRIFAYFKNLPLMAAFLGFGVGFLLHERADRLLPWFPRLCFYLVVLIAGAYGFGLTHVIFVDPRQYMLLGAGFGDHAVQSLPSLLQTLKALVVIVGIFFLVVATFASLTAKLGALLNAQLPLRGYSINVAGSLLGIVGFSVVSFLEWPPVAWLLVALLPLAYFYRGQTRPAVYFLVTIAATYLFGVLNPATWSPYYRVVVRDDPTPPQFIHILVNYDGFQAIQNLSSEYVSQFPAPLQHSIRRHYDLPYRLARKAIESVLILGGGTGNDAAAALRNGARRVDVVEIDPAIARIGARLHPEHPYASDHLQLHVDDARSFLQKSTEKYDLVVFGTLDSHAAFSSLSSIRMDNFVFTRESLQSAKDRLQPGGGIAINFFAVKPWLAQRYFNTLAAEIGGSVLAFGSPTDPEVLLLGGPLFDPSRPLGSTSFVPVSLPFATQSVDATTDDWPFLFLERRGIPFHYLMPLLLILMLAWAPLRVVGVRGRDVNWHLFLMGAAFLLIESKAVTTLAVIFGSTWLVNSIVIGSILIMILLANLSTARLPQLGFPPLYAGLFIALLFNFEFPFETLNRFEWTARLVLAGTITSAPLLLAALIFARAFAVVESPSQALAANLFGSLLGGVLEYGDMWTGLRWLNLVALGLYALSAGALFIQTRRRHTAAATS